MIHNLSDARDTQTMHKLLASESIVLDVLDAGTTMRFLTAFHAISAGEVVLTGTPRMQQRPIKILVEALNELGAQISYEKNEGYPPLRLHPFTGQKNKALTVRGDISSQYISALLMIAPSLPNGLILHLNGKIMSRPYIEMTLALMQHYGSSHHWNDQTITIAPQKYLARDYTVESDWSGASYWFSMVALAEEANLKLLRLRENSLQGDHQIMEIMDKLGVKSSFENDGLRLTKKNHVAEFFQDFSHCPDLAQTVAVTCAAKGITCRMVGLESLRIKETDRIAALQNELSKFGASLTENDKGEWVVTPPASLEIPEDMVIDTYEDHRMAMAFAPLVTKGNLTILEPEVVNKSYPTFWDHLQLVGTKVEFTN